MRILHTSDWHLGQYFYGKTRLHEQSAFLDWLLQQIETLQIDCLVVAGDLFDTGTPPSYARTLLNEFVLKLTTAGCTLVLLAGNHDSVAVLNESQALFRRLGAYLVTGIDRSETDPSTLIPLSTRMGKLGAWLCAVPFIRAKDLVLSQAGQTAEDKQQTLQYAIADYYQQLFQQAQAKNNEQPHKLPIIATGHLTTVGASTSNSVREIYIGSLEAFPASAFPPADYIALGHIHRSQAVAKSDHIRYSGSPFMLSFDECTQAKSILQVDFSEGALTAVTPIEVPCFQPMQSLKGDLVSIERQIEQLVSDHSSIGAGVDIWLDLVISYQDYLSDLQPRIEAFCADLPVEVLLIRRERALKNQTITAQQQEQLHELSVEEVFDRRLQQEPSLEDPLLNEQYQARLRVCFKQALEQLQDTAQSTMQGDAL
ncbi:Exodeoxyribonuclease I subunit D [Oceanospirillum multiglobuliferum]|uniref:Nuclease SbcCD subunit D n=1 Tax=Oceanospirillum multiglobuliferum TaxID=64969 RepID=A0A1T4PFW9_9GAMM|nr:exonuclease subunit SbcD [Oceanospirillum multiglobuliferum]OPX55572.1 exonuclease subunit SbcD [Oceanospirillum multiglobuliferum]SJZ90271.1 Exodeoxyribonuclease I subunit D [Oceanospirillum multiglobuliferum]